MRQLTSRILQMRAYEPLELLTGVPDQEVLRDQVEIVQFLERRQVRLHRVAAHRVVIPGAALEDGRGRPLRRSAQRSNAFGNRVGVSTNELDLRIKHLMHTDKVGAQHIPMHVLESQTQVIVGAELQLQKISNLADLGADQAGMVNSVIVCSSNVSGPDSAYPADGPTKPGTKGGPRDA